MTGHRLRARLQQLRQQSGVDHPHPEPSPCALRQRLARCSTVRRSRSADAQTLARRLGGEAAETGLIVIDRLIAYGARHGRWQVALDRNAQAFFDYPSERTLLFLDTETSGLSGGAGTLAFLLGLGKFTERGLRLRQYLLTAFQGEAAMLADASRFIADTDVMVTYNGKGFDHPLLQARYRLLGQSDPCAALAHWDLLHAIRRAFARRWPDCRLQSVEQRLLGFRRHQDLPSEQVPGVWFRWLRYGQSDDLPRVLRHNHWDLLSLAAAAALLPDCYRRPAAYHADAAAAAKHFLERHDEESAYRHLLTHRGELDPGALLLLARLGQRRGDWDVALGIWRELARQHHIEALQRLAKYYEHVSRDGCAALRCTRRLIELQPRCRDHRHRERRLLLRFPS